MEGRKEQKLQRKVSKAMNSAEMQREWMKQWCERGILGNLNVTFATQEALIGERKGSRIKRSRGAQGTLEAGRVMSHVARD